MSTAIAQVRRRRWRRLIPVGLVATVGLTNALFGLFPGLRTELTEVVPTDPGSGLVLSGRVAAVEAGLVLLVLARSLARGTRWAWRLAVLLTAIGAALGAVSGHVGLNELLAVVTLALLLITHDSFRLRALHASAARWWLPAGAATGLVAFALIGYAEIDQLASTTTSSRVAVIWRTVLFLPGGIDVEQRRVEAYALALRVGFLVLVLTVLWALRPRVTGVGQDRDHIREFACRYGQTSTAPLLALPDNRLLELDQGRAWAAVGVNAGAAISLGAPVAEPGREDAALDEFTHYCEQIGWIPALLATDRVQTDRAHAAGYASIQIGVEATLAVASFSTAGKRRSNIRHSVSRARREQVEVLAYEHTARSARRTAQLAEVSAQWLRTKGGPELGFTLGRFDPDRLDDQEVYVAVRALGTPEEEVVAFVTWLPFADGDHAVLDLMRRAPDCPPGVMELLIVDSLAHFATRGRSGASLGGVPLARDPAAAQPAPDDRAQRMLGWLYDHGGEVYDARGLFRFKDKFDPQWEPMWLAYPSRASLPKIAVAAARAFLPPHVVREVLRARRAAADDALPGKAAG